MQVKVIQMKQNSQMRFKFLCIMLFLIFGITSAHAQTAQQIAKKAFDSTVLLVMEDVNGQPLSLGSGFFVRDGEIASNLHVVEGAARGYAKLVGQKRKYDIEGITAVDPDRDLVILKISDSAAPILALGDSDTVQVGETIYAVGNPKGLEGTFSQGIVSSIRDAGSDKLLQITAAISPGSSGGPVLNEKGKVIGVSVATFRGGQNLNFAIPSIYLKSLLGKAGFLKPLTQTKPTKQRSILSDLGGKSTEAVVVENLVWDNKFFIGGDYSYTIKNKLREPVKGIVGILIFYDLKGNPIDFQMISYENIVPGGFGKRVNGRVDESVKRLSTRPRPGYDNSHDRPDKIEYRILFFDVVESDLGF